MNSLAISIFLLCFNLTNSHAFDLKVDITNIKSSSGNIKVGVFPRDAGFPSEHHNTRARAVLEIDRLKATHTFLNLPEDEYAVAVFHDVNSNNQLDLNSAGIPKEPFGFSNNPIILGPPSFKKSKIRLDGNKMINIELKKIF